MVGVAAALVPALSFAAYLNAGSNIYVAGTEASSQNAYVAGGVVSVSSPVGGDLLAAGANVFVSGKVAQDLMIGGGTVNVIGASAQDARIAAANITLSAALSGEAFLAGAQIVVAPGTTIAKDSYLFGGAVTFGGNEAGNLTISGGDIRIDGAVNGDVLIKRANKVTLGSNAVIKGALTYSAPEPLIREDGAQVTGSITFNKTEARTSASSGQGFFAAFATMWLLAKFIAILAMVYLFWYARRNDARAVIEHARGRFWRSLFQGFAFAVLVPVAAVILLFTVIGAIPAIVGILVYIAVLIITTPFAAIFAASFLAKARSELRWYHLFFGALIFFIIGIIPIVGWIANCIMYLAALGGIARILGLKFKENG